MYQRLLITIILFFFITQANAQLGVMKLVGKNTKDYKLGFGGFIKTGLPVTDGTDITLEIGADVFFLDDYTGDEGTIMCPLKAGYRYTINQSGYGFYVEPQVGFNLYGVTSVYDDEEGKNVNLKYHGAVLAAGAGYLFDIWRAPFDLNLRYETIIAHGGSNNFISLGISRFFSFRKRDTGY